MGGREGGGSSEPRPKAGFCTETIPEVNPKDWIIRVADGAGVDQT